MMNPWVLLATMIHWSYVTTLSYMPVANVPNFHPQSHQFSKIFQDFPVDFPPKMCWNIQLPSFEVGHGLPIWNTPVTPAGLPGHTSMLRWSRSVTWFPRVSPGRPYGGLWGMRNPRKTTKRKVESLFGWWFGNIWNMNGLWLSIQLGISWSQLTNSIIFQRGRYTTNQL